MANPAAGASSSSSSGGVAAVAEARGELRRASERIRLTLATLEDVIQLIDTDTVGGSSQLHPAPAQQQPGAESPAPLTPDASTALGQPRSIGSVVSPALPTYQRPAGVVDHGHPRSSPRDIPVFARAPPSAPGGIRADSAQPWKGPGAVSPGFGTTTAAPAPAWGFSALSTGAESAAHCMPPGRSTPPSSPGAASPAHRTPAPSPTSMVAVEQARSMPGAEGAAQRTSPGTETGATSPAHFALGHPRSCVAEGAELPPRWLRLPAPCGQEGRLECAPRGSGDAAAQRRQEAVLRAYDELTEPGHGPPPLAEATQPMTELGGGDYLSPRAVPGSRAQLWAPMRSRGAESVAQCMPPGCSSGSPASSGVLAAGAPPPAAARAKELAAEPPASAGMGIAERVGRVPRTVSPTGEGSAHFEMQWVCTQCGEPRALGVDEVKGPATVMHACGSSLCRFQLRTFKKRPKGRAASGGLLAPGAASAMASASMPLPARTVSTADAEYDGESKDQLSTLTPADYMTPQKQQKRQWQQAEEWISAGASPAPMGTGDYMRPPSESTPARYQVVLLDSDCTPRTTARELDDPHAPPQSPLGTRVQRAGGQPPRPGAKSTGALSMGAAGPETDSKSAAESD